MKVSTVLFDIGNVLSHDGHETYLSDEKYGLARSLCIPREELLKKVTHIFRKYAVLPSANESAFWNEVSEVLGIVLTAKAIKKVKEQIKTVNIEAVVTFKRLQREGIDIGIIANSTSFFYRLQAKLLSLSDYVQPELIFLSHEKGCLKSGGLFEIAAKSLDPQNTYVIEDRQGNIEYAQKIGFCVAPYSLEGGTSLLAIINRMITENQ